jgi:hypothetical protein
MNMGREERSDVLERILHLRTKSMSLSQIAEECGLTVGQVKYQLRKSKQLIHQTASSEHAEPQMPERPELVPSDQAEEKAGQGWRLPSFYAKDKVKVMVQGPTILYVYWEITWPRMRMVASYLQADTREIEKGLRLYDVTDRFFDGANAHSYLDIKVTEEASSWYINGVQPGRTYIADFGLFHEDRFCPILRSEPAATPRNRKAEWGEPLVEPVTDTRYPTWFENFASYSLYTK